MDPDHDSEFFIVVDCEWSEWQVGQCSMSCGEGVRMNNRTEIKEAEYGGEPCHGNLTKLERCNVKKCPSIVYLNFSQYAYYIIIYSISL